MLRHVFSIFLVICLMISVSSDLFAHIRCPVADNLSNVVLSSIFCQQDPNSYDPNTYDPNVYDSNSLADINQSGFVNIADFDILADQWLISDCNVPDWCLGADITMDGVADVNDLVCLADHWLEEFLIYATVPDVNGLSRTNAEAQILTAGLNIGTVTYEYSLTVPDNCVIRQSPHAGQKVPLGSNVSIVMSSVTMVIVPNVIGTTQSSGQAAILAAGLTVGTVTLEFSQNPAGIIIGQSPAGGSQAPANSSVNLTVSKGAPIIVPDVTGMTQSQASLAITAAGLQTGTVTQERSALVETGLIIRQTPAGGQQAAAGSSVNIVVSTGPTYFYVAKNGSDQNDGTRPTQQGGGKGPFATIQKGLTVLAQRDACGDILAIRTGTYYEECTSFGGITPSAQVLIENYNGEEVYIDGSIPVTNWHPCQITEPNLCVNGLMPPNWNTYYDKVYKADVNAISVYTFTDKPYYGVKLVYENQLQVPCGIINMPYAVFPDLENYGWEVGYGTSTTLRDSVNLTQANDFWNNAYVWFIGDTDNVAYCREIIDFNSSTDTVTIEECPARVDPGKKYWIFNHPHYLNNEGEYYWEPNAVDGYYTVYYYKRSSETLANLNSYMRVLSKSAGIRFSSSSNNLIIRGLNFRNCQTTGNIDSRGNIINGGPTGQCGFICCTNWCNSVANIKIENCTFKNFYGNEGAAIVFGECENDISIENCFFEDVGRGAGIRLYGESNDKIQRVTVADCNLARIWGSNIRPYYARDVRITNNYITQFDGVHGNAVTVYGSCDNVLVAHNMITGGTNALAMKDMNGMYIFGNVFRSTDESGSVSVWDVDYRAVTGNLYVLQNTILTSSPSETKALFFLNQNSLYPPDDANVIVKNNIIDGFEYAACWNNSVFHDYNLYLEASDHQSGTCSECVVWTYGLHEITNINGHTEEFVNYANEDYRLSVFSTARNAGLNLDFEIDLIEQIFPSYNIDMDMQGIPWANPPSMGAFEY